MLFSAFSWLRWRTAIVLSSTDSTQENNDGVPKLNVTHSAYLHPVEDEASNRWCLQYFCYSNATQCRTPSCCDVHDTVLQTQDCLFMPLSVLQYPALLVLLSGKTVCEIDSLKLSRQDERFLTLIVSRCQNSKRQRVSFVTFLKKRASGLISEEDDEFKCDQGL